MLSVIMLNVIMLNAIMLNAIMLNAIMPNAIMLNAIMLSVMAPRKGKQNKNSEEKDGRKIATVSNFFNDKIAKAFSFVKK
jgi:hypothetical protein